MEQEERLIQHGDWVIIQRLRSDGTPDQTWENPEQNWKASSTITKSQQGFHNLNFNFGTSSLTLSCNITEISYNSTKKQVVVIMPNGQYVITKNNMS